MRCKLTSARNGPCIMKILVTGSSGHLGEALLRSLPDHGHQVMGVDLRPSPFTHHVGSICDRAFVARCMRGADAVIHTATLHKPHVATHSRQAFVDTNISGTLNLLEEASEQGIKAFVFTSTTSTYGAALTPPPDRPAAWITEDVLPVPKNIYGVTKVGAEDLCQLFHRLRGLPTLVLRTSRFFPEGDDDELQRSGFVDANLKVNELLHRRVDVQDAVDAHRLALERAPAIGHGRYIISATAPFDLDDAAELRTDLPAVVRRRVPFFEAEYQRRGWRLLPGIDRVYVNGKARHELGWTPRHDFGFAIDRLREGEDYRSPLARAIGAKGYAAPPR
jgi:UDP-glucose 4-epimerase